MNRLPTLGRDLLILWVALFAVTATWSVDDGSIPQSGRAGCHTR